MASAFFLHEILISTPKGDTTEIIEARADWLKLNEISKNSLDQLKEMAKGTLEYDKYISDYKNNIESNKKLKLLKEENKFLGFKNFKYFLGEIGWALGLFLYSLFNLLEATFRRIEKKETSAIKVYFHSIILYISLFFIRWCFLKEDYTKLTYIFTTMLCASAVVYLHYLVLKSLLKNDKMKILVRWIFEVRHTHYQKMALKALDNTEKYNETLNEIEEYEELNTRNLFEAFKEEYSQLQNEDI